MKKLFAALLLALIASFAVPTISESNHAKAQLVTMLKPPAAKDTLTNTDTTVIYLGTSQQAAETSTTLVDNISRSVQLYGLKRSGNVGSSKIYLQATLDGTNYVTLDSLIFTDQSVNFKVVGLRDASGSLLYKTYRLYCLSAGTCTWEPRAYFFRRSN